MQMTAPSTRPSNPPNASDLFLSALFYFLMRMADHLEQVYTEEALKHRYDADLSKLIYHKIAEQSLHRIQEQREEEKKKKQEQNQQIASFWKQEEHYRAQAERKRKEMINEVRKFNKSLVDTSEPYRDGFSQIRSDQRKASEEAAEWSRKKEQKVGFYQEAQQLEQVRKEQMQSQKELDTSLNRQKRQEYLEMEQRRQAYFEKFKQKHYQDHHPVNFRLWEQSNHEKSRQYEALDHYIVDRGAWEIQERVRRSKERQLEAEKNVKQLHLKQLKQQLEDNSYKQAIDKYLERSFQKEKINSIHQQLDKQEQLRQSQKKEQDKEHLEALKSQIRPKAKEENRIQFAGIGSPVHIGKLMHDDRRRQMQRVQQDLKLTLGL